MKTRTGIPLHTLILCMAVTGLGVAFSYERGMNDSFTSGHIAVMQPEQSKDFLASLAGGK